MKRLALLGLAVLLVTSSTSAQEPIRLANNPALSPQGQWLAFDWNGDIWIVPADGGEAKQFTAHPSRDMQPKFSPDGQTIAFISEREGSPQVYTAPFAGGGPVQRTFHTAGASLQEWTPDGSSFLIRATRDQFWRHGERFFIASASQRSAEKLLFDDYGADGALSPDGKKLLFTREGDVWWRKGYEGSRAAQIWLYDRDAKTFTKVLHEKFSCRWPLWKPDGKGFYFVGEHPRGSNLCSYDFGAKSIKQLTKFKEDSVVFPCITRDGSLIAFRHLFDLYSMRTTNEEVRKLEIHHNVDRLGKKTEPRLLTSATEVRFAPDGLEMAFVAGGDLWVMDTLLREPRQITKTPGEEANPIFSPGGKTIIFTTNLAGRFVIASAARDNAKEFWWQNRKFILTVLAEMDDPPTKLKLSPDGAKLAYVRGRGDLWIADFLTKQNKIFFAGWNAPDYDWSPDGKWIVYAQQDDDFNRDIWLLPVDGSRKPYNLSRHPYTEGDPVWSPDGKMIAFTGRRASGDNGANIGLVWLNEDDEKTAYDRKLEKALEKMKGRATPGKSAAKADTTKEETKKPARPEVVIDFALLHERVKRVTLGDGSASEIFWSPDAKKLAFTGNFEGKPGTFAIDVGDTLTPKLLTTTVGKNPVWLQQGNQIVWLVNGVPTSTPGTGPIPAAPVPEIPVAKRAPAKAPAKTAPVAAPTPASPGSYTFSARQEVDVPARHGVIFDTCWSIMRDHWYDGNLGNNDWNIIRKKYHDLARQCPDAESLTTVIQLMLGELNGSHLGFTMKPETKPAKSAPPDVTPHLGVRFDPAAGGPGLKIRDVLPNGPADKKRSRLAPGEIIRTIDGMIVSPESDLTEILNGQLDRDVALRVQGLDGKVREVLLRPISQQAAQLLLYEQWLRHNRKLVADASKDKLGYLHISQMAMPNFRKFEEELVSEGTGKDGLVIDVRENPGGSITDHLLTALTQPVHAITVPRGGSPGYPLDRKVYISWHKPIVVLCNQNSGSNAEIFSHAIKTLKRGQLVGVPTAGAVVSTGVATIMDAGTLRLPTRGWFTIKDGEDMERHGAAPDHLLWLNPGDLPQGRDAQLAKAIEVLQADVQAWRDRPQPKLRKATERK